MVIPRGNAGTPANETDGKAQRDQSLLWFHRTVVAAAAITEADLNSKLVNWSWNGI
jgi:hypothetical protein